jgi:hypothetical protein
MIPRFRRTSAVVAALVLVGLISAVASAQWTVVNYQPTPFTTYSTFYAPSTVSVAPVAWQTNSPVVVQTYRPVTGWYPGYWLNRTANWLWGRPVTVVAAVPTTTVASFPVTQSVSYAPSSGCSTCPNYTASYAPAPCTTCAPVQQVTLRPICETGCTACPAPIVQSGYAVSSGCTTCTTPAAVAQPTPAGQDTGRPGLDPGSGVPVERQRVPTENTGDDVNNAEAQKMMEGLKAQGDADGQQSSFFQAPELFDPRDTSVQWSPAPVQRAVYRRPQGTSAAAVTAQHVAQPKAKLKGWVSASD